MRVAGMFAAAVLLVAAQTGAGQSRRVGAGSGIVHVVIDTDRGAIGADLDSAHAPLSVSNFLRYVDAGLYVNGRFHRTVTPDNQPRDSVKIGVIQGGRAAESGGFPPIALERTTVTGLHHLDGTLSMARAAANTATSDFFICIGDQPALDFGGHRNLDGQGFAAFGRVTSGMDVVRAIQHAPAQGQQLTPPVRILDIRRRGAGRDSRSAR
jgi:peptidyl-prolyl cis-trans isomerase A (cyclophilin A)